MGTLTRLGLLVAAIGRLSLSPPSVRATGHATVALATVASTAYREHRSAFRFLALPQAEDGISIRSNVRHLEIMPHKERNYQRLPA